MCLRRIFSILLVFLLSILPVRGQPSDGITIKGTVHDDSTGAPLPSAHVFLSGTMTGTTVDEDGHFRLTGISSGAKRLFVSRIGYEPIQIDLVLPPDTTLTYAFRLTPTVIKAEEVTVAGRRDEDWYDRLERFKRLFIGQSRWAEQCRLQNPKALYFDTSWWGKFEADATRPLVFVNRALGYRVTYYLKEFEKRGDVVRWDGEPVFEQLTPRDSTEAARWAANRREAFLGSLRHFLLALLTDRLEQEQFRIYRLPRATGVQRIDRADRIPTTRDRILSPQPDSLYELSFSGGLEVRYLGASEKPAYLSWAKLNRSPRGHQTSAIRLNERPIHVDVHGEVVETYGATLYRYFAFRQRLAAMLPQEYRPQGTTLAASPPTDR